MSPKFARILLIAFLNIVSHQANAASKGMRGAEAANAAGGDQDNQQPAAAADPNAQQAQAQPGGQTDPNAPKAMTKEEFRKAVKERSKELYTAEVIDAAAREHATKRYERLAWLYSPATAGKWMNIFLYTGFGVRMYGLEQVENGGCDTATSPAIGTYGMGTSFYPFGAFQLDARFGGDSEFGPTCLTKQGTVEILRPRKDYMNARISAIYNLAPFFGFGAGFALQGTTYQVRADIPQIITGNGGEQISMGGGGPVRFEDQFTLSYGGGILTKWTVLGAVFIAEVEFYNKKVGVNTGEIRQIQEGYFKIGMPNIIW